MSDKATLNYRMCQIFTLSKQKKEEMVEISPKQ